MLAGNFCPSRRDTDGGLWQGLSAIVAQMNTAELAAALQTLGCPPEKSAEMAAQLDKRARQLAEQKGRTYEAAMKHLLGLMGQGWAAQPGTDRNKL